MEILFLKVCLIFNNVYLCLICVCEYMYSLNQEQSSGFLRTGVKGSCDLPTMGSGNQITVLY